MGGSLLGVFAPPSPPARNWIAAFSLIEGVVALVVSQQFSAGRTWARSAAAALFTLLGIQLSFVAMQDASVQYGE
ncbi:MAG TPA: hypothetical protein VM598_03295, partial [Bdellovibrionota bacterium]|nr:hypothetical protein [Bdellovibrionota bacterium]